MRKAAGFLALIVLGIALAASGPDRPAIAGGVNDPRELPGHAKADIRSITAHRDGHTLVHTLETYGPWANRDLGAEGITIRFTFYTGREGQHGRYVLVTSQGNTLAATLYARHQPARTVDASRPDDRTVEVRVPIPLVEGEHRRQTYEWRADINQQYATPVPCEPGPTPSPSVSPASTPSGSPGSPSPSPSQSFCGHGDYFSQDVAPDHGRLQELFRELPRREKQPPATTVRVGDRRLGALHPWTWEWSFPSGGTQANVIADGVPGWRPVREVHVGQRLALRFERSDRPRYVKVTAYPRLGRHNEVEGRRRRIASSLQPVHSNGRGVAWDAVFKLDIPDHDYYMYVTGKWEAEGRHLSGGTAWWSLHVRTRS